MFPSAGAHRDASGDLLGLALAPLNDGADNICRVRLQRVGDPQEDGKRRLRLGNLQPCDERPMHIRPMSQFLLAYL